ncbi:hypothetical protein AH04_142 [Erwinia phage AH04]|uniref:Virion structural protein n=1 Tax=Erwinia phage AH04 TaxID=2869569 RepID=A0AAE8BQ45_9CAUD|nr:tail protein [Erwinia phage AH04]QZA70619.1 hypothetical protein AH04_142 [Erwinia phage AH04]
MIKEDIPLYKLDLTGTSKFNLVLQEPKSRTEVVNNQIFIPPKGPFYQKSFKMFDNSGKPLVEGEDYEFYGIMAKLTQYTGKPVGLFVRILKDSIVDWKMDYQVVGNFNVITNEILNMLQSIYQDDRYVMWDNIDNKPLWYIPDLHQHDLAYDIFGFTDLVKELNRVATYVTATSSATEFMLQSFQDHLAVYIDGYKDILTKMLNRHIGNKTDAHGVNKAGIGLANVANVRVATLDETLDGTRDDLRITVYNAAKAAEASSGRNDKLFPSGSLPILRYGSDTFIPPTIGGSFEGLGGTSRRSGAIVETDGTLLVMTHRNNGKYRGLYFTRCVNWQEASPNYDFTSYLYQHPTATAAGATLDTIINGSNRYIMVVGDRAKNLWWWCETHGTFNPDRHTLIPLSGEWVSQDMAAPYNISDVYEISSLACVLADQNYADYWSLVQPYQIAEFIKRRPTQYPDYDTLGGVVWGNGAIINAGASFNIVAGKSGTIKRAIVDFTHPIFGNFKDKYWSPWLPKVENINGSYVTTSAYAKYDPPIVNVLNFRSIFAYWLNNGNFGEYSFRYEHIGQNSGLNMSLQNQVVYRATLKITRNGNDFTVVVDPAAGCKDLYTIDISNKTVKDYDLYIKNMTTSFIAAKDLDQVGSTVLTGGYVQFSQGTAGTSFPPAYTVGKATFLESAQALLLPPNGEANFDLNYDHLTFTETNPLGMATQFSTQRLLSASDTDYTKAGYLVRQFIGTTPQWFFRPTAYMNANWDHVPPPLTSSFSGRNLQHYPFTPTGYTCTMGFQVFPGTQMPIVGANNSTNQKKFLGATCDTTITGIPPTDNPNGVGRALGDSILPYEVSTKLVDGVMTVTPTIAIDLKTALTNVIVPAFAAAGISEYYTRETWAVHLALNPTGEWHAIWVVFSMNAPDQVMAAMVTTLTPTGTPTQQNGYALYPNAGVTQKSAVKTLLRTPVGPNNALSHPRYNVGNGASIPFFLGTPYKGTISGAKDLSAYSVIMNTSTRFNTYGGGMPTPFVMEIKADGSEITKLGFVFIQDFGGDNTVSGSPYYGPGNAANGATIFEGAAIASTIYDQERGIYDSVIGGNFSSVFEIGMSNILTPQFTVYFQQVLNVLIAGKMYDIPATYIDILTIDSSPANKTFYVYLQYSSGQGVYAITRDVRPESSSQALIAKVICGPTQIDRIEPYNRFTMDGAQVSAKREGSAILASSGSVFDIGDTSTILLNTDFIS